MLANSATTRNSRARRGSTASDISTGSRKKINNTTTIKTPQKAWSQSSSTKKTSNPPSSSSIKQSDSTCSIASKAGSTDQTNKSTVPPPPPRLRAALNHPTKSSRTNPQVIAERYEMLMQLNNRNDRELRENLKKLRTMVLREGLLEGSEASSDSSACSLRGRIWKTLMGVYKVSTQEYVSYIERGPSEVYDKIKNDTFRTLATDKKFLSKVNEAMLSRVLNAFVWKSKDMPSSRFINLSYSYVQGMNVLAAPFLYVMPELDAFFAFSTFIQQFCPLYVQPALEGVHFGLKLLDKCLKTVDPHLFHHLKSKGLTAKVYAMPSLLTFSACTPPLNEVLKLWDFYFAFGFHLNVLAVVAQIECIRDELLSATSPMKLLRTLPPLHANRIISITLNILPELPDYLYDLLVRHTYDPTIDGAINEDDEEDEDDEDDEEEREVLHNENDEICSEADSKSVNDFQSQANETFIEYDTESEFGGGIGEQPNTLDFLADPQPESLSPSPVIEDDVGLSSISNTSRKSSMEALEGVVIHDFEDEANEGMDNLIYL